MEVNIELEQQLEKTKDIVTTVLDITNIERNNFVSALLSIICALPYLEKEKFGKAIAHIIYSLE